MTAEERIRTLCNVMSEYHDCDYSLRHAQNGEEYYNVIDIAHILNDDDTTLKVRNHIHRFTMAEINLVSPTLNDMSIFKYMNHQMTDFRNSAYDGDFDEAIKHWNSIIKVIEKLALTNSDVKKELEQWRLDKQY